MTATPGEGGLPPFAIYRATTAHWADGTIKLLYSKIKGQGRMVLIEELPGEDPVELGNKYQLTLVRIEDGEPIPPIELPTFPVLPENPIAILPPDYQKPVPPIGVVPPDYIGVEPPIGKPEYPGVEKPIEKPGTKPSPEPTPEPK